LTASSHEPVLVEDVVRLLVTDRRGRYLDLNVGFGGHAEAICESLEEGFRFIGIDLDEVALAAARRRLERFGESVTLVRGNHREFPLHLRRQGVEALSGILFDLGVSSAQLDDASYGFSFDRPGPLDMRYGRSGETASELLRRIDENTLSRALREYGDLAAAPRMARALVGARETAPLETTGALAALVDRTLRPHPRRRRKVLSQVFQTLRYLVNDEVSAFTEALAACHDHLLPSGVLCVLAYESVTDRAVKRLFNPPDVERDAYGERAEPLRWERLTRRAIRPAAGEVARNPRARSARLRAARRARAEA
jgi:16S rRNA (cytosine1402-N4)-methyltransferase